MYLVRFIRKDCQPNEEYFYYNRKDASHHLELFRGDDSGIYRCIDFLKSENSIETIIETVRF